MRFYEALIHFSFQKKTIAGKIVSNTVARFTRCRVGLPRDGRNNQHSILE